MPENSNAMSLTKVCFDHSNFDSVNQPIDSLKFTEFSHPYVNYLWIRKIYSFLYMNSIFLNCFN